MNWNIAAGNFDCVSSLVSGDNKIIQRIGSKIGFLSFILQFFAFSVVFHNPLIDLFDEFPASFSECFSRLFAIGLGDKEDVNVVWSAGKQKINDASTNNCESIQSKVFEDWVAFYKGIPE